MMIFEFPGKANVVIHEYQALNTDGKMLDLQIKNIFRRLRNRAGRLPDAVVFTSKADTSQSIEVSNNADVRTVVLDFFNCPDTVLQSPVLSKGIWETQPSQPATVSAAPSEKQTTRQTGGQAFEWDEVSGCCLKWSAEMRAALSDLPDDVKEQPDVRGMVRDEAPDEEKVDYGSMIIKENATALKAVGAQVRCWDNSDAVMLAYLARGWQGTHTPK